MLFPLSDFPALIAFLAGVYFFISDKKIKTYLFSGIFFAVAYNTRTIYLYPFVFCILYICVEFFFTKNRAQHIGHIVALVVGFILIELPQLYVNVRLFNTKSLFVQNKGILYAVIGYGQYAANYLTLVNNSGGAYGKFFIYQASNTALKKFGPIQSNADVIRYITTNFGMFCKMFAIKIFTAIDTWYSHCYIPENWLTKNTALFRNINYSIFFLAGIVLTQIKYNLKFLFSVLIILIPSIVALLGHVETRYFLTLFVLVYALVAFYFASNYEKNTVFVISNKAVFFISLLFIVYLFAMNYFSNIVFSWAV